MNIPNSMKPATPGDHQGKGVASGSLEMADQGRLMLPLKNTLSPPLKRASSARVNTAKPATPLMRGDEPSPRPEKAPSTLSKRGNSDPDIV
jgi:hypothetical protein